MTESKGDEDTQSASLSIRGEVPETILCQHKQGSCASCCGVYNFVNRDSESHMQRLTERTKRVVNAYPDPKALLTVKEELIALEKPDVLFSSIPVCPFAGFVEEGRVGCLVHPRRHPEKIELRHLGVYPSAVCEGHFCAPHDWLRPREVRLAQTVRGLQYGLIVTDAGLLKSLLKLIDEHLGRQWNVKICPLIDAELQNLWSLIETWPYRDTDPNRFGGFYVTGPDAVERTVPQKTMEQSSQIHPAMSTLFDALGSQFKSSEEFQLAVRMIEKSIDELARTIERGAQDALVVLNSARSSEDQ